MLSEGLWSTHLGTANLMASLMSFCSCFVSALNAQILPLRFKLPIENLKKSRVSVSIFRTFRVIHFPVVFSALVWGPVTTQFHNLGGVNDRDVLSYGSRVCKFELKLSAGLASSKGHER